MSKVWKKVVITKTTEVMIGIDEDRLTEEFLTHYSKHFSEAEDMYEIFDTVAFQYVNGGHRFAEGVGKVGGKFDKEDDFPVIVKELYEDTDVEVVETEEEPSFFVKAMVVVGIVCAIIAVMSLL